MTKDPAEVLREVITETATLESLQAALMDQGISPEQIVCVLPIERSVTEPVNPTRLRVLYRKAA